MVVSGFTLAERTAIRCLLNQHLPIELAVRIVNKNHLWRLLRQAIRILSICSRMRDYGSHAVRRACMRRYLYNVANFD